MIVCRSRPGFGTRRGIGGKSKGLPEREERRKAKRLFFDTTEATNLLKIKDRVFKKGKNELVFKRQLPPHAPQNRDFCQCETPFEPFLGQITGGYMAFHVSPSYIPLAGESTPSCWRECPSLIWHGHLGHEITRAGCPCYFLRSAVQLVTRVNGWQREKRPGTLAKSAVSAPSRSAPGVA
jgi:hypothetical protein